jgi:hypothetical protein
LRKRLPPGDRKAINKLQQRHHREMALRACAYARGGVPVIPLDPCSLKPVEPINPYTPGAWSNLDQRWITDPLIKVSGSKEVRPLEQAFLDGWVPEAGEESIEAWTKYAPGSAIGMMTAEHGSPNPSDSEWVLVRVQPHANSDARLKALRAAESFTQRITAVRDTNSGHDYLWALTPLSAAVKPRRIAPGVELFARDRSYTPLPPTPGFRWIRPDGVLAGGACKEPA